MANGSSYHASHEVEVTTRCQTLCGTGEYSGDRFTWNFHHWAVLSGGLPPSGPPLTYGNNYYP